MLTEILKTQPNIKLDFSKLVGMEKVDQTLQAVLEESPGALRDIGEYLMKAGGKRVRPVLTIYSGLVFGPFSEELVKTAAAAELIHMASLIHDDIIDDAASRHHLPSVKTVWGNHVAVLAGDYLFAKAFGLLAEIQNPRALKLMVETIEKMCAGEVVQAQNRFNSELSLAEYYNCIGKKTASFLEGVCQSGAVIAGATAEQVQTMGEYGLSLGLAFQIKDDLLDFYGQSEIMGKPKFEDLRQGNLTLPVLLLLQTADYGTWTRNKIKQGYLEERDLTEVAELLTQTGITREVSTIASSYLDQAKNCLQRLPRTEGAILLEHLANQLQERVY